MDHYPESNSEWQNLDVEMWKNESYQAAISAVYPTVAPNEPLSQAYLAKGQDQLKKLIVLGGLRLSYVIEHIFGGSTEAPETFLQ